MNYPFFRQLRKDDCGLAVIIMLLSYYNQDSNLNYLYQKLKKEKGLSIKDLVIELNKGNIKSSGVMIDNHQLLTLKRFPVVLYLKEKERGHFVLIYKSKRNKFLVADPGSNQLQLIDKQEIIKSYSKMAILIEGKKEKKRKKINKLQILFLILAFIEILLVSLSSFALGNLIEALPTKNTPFIILIFLYASLLQVGSYCYLTFKLKIALWTSKLLDKKVRHFHFNKILKVSCNKSDYFTPAILFNTCNDLDNLKQYQISQLTILSDLVIAFGFLIIIFIYFTIAGLFLIIFSLILIFFLLLIKKRYYRQVEQYIDYSQQFENNFHQQDVDLSGEYHLLTSKQLKLARLDNSIALIIQLIKMIITILFLMLFLFDQEISNYFVLLTLFEFYFPALIRILKNQYNKVDINISLNRLKAIALFEKK